MQKLGVGIVWLMFYMTVRLYLVRVTSVLKPFYYLF